MRALLASQGICNFHNILSVELVRQAVPVFGYMYFVCTCQGAGSMPRMQPWDSAKSCSGQYAPPNLHQVESREAPNPLEQELLD